MDAAYSLVKQKGASQFLIKLGKDFNVVARECSLSGSELFSIIFDHVLSMTLLETNDVKLVAVVKYTDPRVTLLRLRKDAHVNMSTFKQNFVMQVIHYFTNASPDNEKAQKELELLFSIELEC